MNQGAQVSHWEPTPGAARGVAKVRWPSGVGLETLGRRLRRYGGPATALGFASSFPTRLSAAQRLPDDARQPGGA